MFSWKGFVGKPAILLFFFKFVSLKDSVTRFLLFFGQKTLPGSCMNSLKQFYENFCFRADIVVDYVVTNFSIVFVSEVNDYVDTMSV